MTSRRTPAWHAAIGLTLAVGLAVAVPPARAQDGCDGVRVVVDATALGGALTARCLAGDPGSGLEALRDAGHTYTFVPRQPGLVCTIDARPDPCNGAPEDAYWSYWHAPAGGSWTYSTRGAGNRDPDPGTVEGWAFGAGDPPREPPPPATADEPEPQPAEEPAPEPDPTAPPADGGSGADTGDDPALREGDGTRPADEGTRGPEGDDPGAPTPAPVASPAPGQGASPSELELDDPPGPVEPATASPVPSPLAGEVIPADEGGAPVGLVAGGLLVAGLAGAGVARARRRDRA